ncbi:MAG: hypothetical protein RBU37_15405 [Myxococcota bacterium]|jgi:hypothetical protein|nr:hypothetical protein [Myxococcota bacterium]
MDPTWAKKLVDRVCADLALKKAARTLRPVGLAVALGTASMLGCGGEDLYGVVNPDEEQSEDVNDLEDGEDIPEQYDVYAAPDIPETETYPDLYGVWVDETELPPDLYGVWVDETELPDELYGIVDVEEDDSELPVDAYGIADVSD